MKCHNMKDRDVSKVKIKRRDAIRAKLGKFFGRSDGPKQLLGFAGSDWRSLEPMEHALDLEDWRFSLVNMHSIRPLRANQLHQI